MSIHEAAQGSGLTHDIKRILQPVVRNATQIRTLIYSALWRLRLKELGRGSEIRRTAKIYGASRVQIGKRSVLNDFVHIWGSGGVIIGDNCLLATHVVVTSQSHDINALERGLLYRDTSLNAPVTIGSNVWIGSGACILPGVTIGSGAVVAAGAVVTHDVPERCLVLGVPARPARLL